jgi:PAS domain S-box
LGYAFEIHSSSLSEILFWLKIEYLGIPFFPTLLLLFSFQFIEKKHWLKPWIIATLLSISTLNLIAHFTNAYTHWFYASVTLDTSGILPLIKTTKGFWYWIHQGYSIVSMGLFNVLFFIMLWQNDKMKRKQALVMQLSSLPPWIGYLIYITGNSPHGIDLIPFSFIIMGFIAAWGMFRYKLFNLAPLALENVFEYMSDGVIILDQQDNISSFNKAAKEMFTVLSAKNTGLSIKTLYHTHPGLVHIINNTSDKGLEIESGDGTRHFEVKVSVVYNKKAIPIGKTLIFRDVTERKQTEQLLITNQDRLLKLNQTKDRLFSIIGHDLRGPLGNIRSLSYMMNDTMREKLSSDVLRITQILENSSEQALKLLENLLVWAKSQTGGIQFNPQAFTLNKLVNETLEVLLSSATQKQISFENKIPADLMIYADYQMISLVIRNLVSNAIKFTHRNGTISIACDISDNQITIRVSDSGIGIPKDIMDQLFSLNKSTRRNGTDKEFGSGLGLILCKEFIDAHQGKIGVESSSENGSVFFFTIPAKLPETSNK